jgi:hypothetical protein
MRTVVMTLQFRVAKALYAVLVRYLPTFAQSVKLSLPKMDEHGKTGPVHICEFQRN